VKNITERQNDILSIIARLDISPTMYSNAVEKYNNITNFISDCGIDAVMYPQGSFAIGTVVRPSAKDHSASYDLDFICQIRGNRTNYTPSELRKKIENALTSSDVYGGRLEVYDECFTIEYADINGVGFKIDIVPATDESYENKIRLMKESKTPELINTAIAIPKYISERNYEWMTNNPKGFRTWFEKINEPFLFSSRTAFRQRLFEENKHIYSSVEEIPRELERSALQRVIQILKYHRDIYYSKIKDGDEIKPISAIINVVVAQISLQYIPNCTVFELLEFVLNELNIYAQQQQLTQEEFTKAFGNRTIFSRPEGMWYIPNPANPEDNLANKWNQDSRIPVYFFRWVKTVKSDLIDSLQQVDDQQFRIAIENSLGKTVVSNVLGNKYCGEISPKQINPYTAAKPYRSL